MIENDSVKKKTNYRNPQQHEFHNYVQSNRPDIKEYI